MPREMIYPTAPADPDGDTTQTRRVEVGWQRNCGVQVGTSVLKNPTNITATRGGVFEPTWDGEFVDLDRGQINELIRSLRRARDQAFGRDE